MRNIIGKGAAVAAAICFSLIYQNANRVKGIKSLNSITTASKEKHMNRKMKFTV